MTIVRDATAINDGTTAIMAVSLRNHGDNGGATAVYAVQAPQWYRASGVTGVLQKPRSGATVCVHRKPPLAHFDVRKSASKVLLYMKDLQM